MKGREKSGRLRRVSVKVPGNAVKLHFRQHKPKKSVCAVYGTPLAGVPCALPAKLRNMPKTAKRPQRPYGGVLSSRAMRDIMKTKARAL